MSAPRIILNLHNEYIKDTLKGAIVQDMKVFLCDLTYTVLKGINSPVRKVYIGTKALKHNYDKRPAVEYDFLINNLHQIIKYPQIVYENKPSKRGSYCFVKSLDDVNWLCSLELVEDNQNNLATQIEIVTFFRVPKEKYLDTYTLLWSWRDDNTPSS